ncbi:hypothetical protein C8J57DRAFT_1254025 [Mycena rebaudengoi]|nr:hypothetical protein C8J57DRAFT_1254025 [Mycena rebaudengoi]
MDPELVISELLVSVRALKAVKRNKLFKLTAQVELLKAEIDTLNQILVEVTKSEQKFVQAQAKLKKKYQNQKNTRSDLQRGKNQELAVTLNKKPAVHCNHYCHRYWPNFIFSPGSRGSSTARTEKNQELIIALNKKPALPPNGPSEAKWRERCEKLQEQYQTLQLCYKRLKTEL